MQWFNYLRSTQSNQLLMSYDLLFFFRSVLCLMIGLIKIINNWEMMRARQFFRSLHRMVCNFFCSFKIFLSRFFMLFYVWSTENFSDVIFHFCKYFHFIIQFQNLEFTQNVHFLSTILKKIYTFFSKVRTFWINPPFWLFFYYY
jgi:hypothetical protein